MPRQKHEFAVILVLDIDNAPTNLATRTHDYVALGANVNDSERDDIS